MIRYNIVCELKLLYYCVFILCLLFCITSPLAAQEVDSITVKIEQKDLAKNVELYLNDIKNQTYTPRLAKMAEQLSQQALKPFGYYLPTVAVTHTEKEGKIDLIVSIKAGLRVTISEVSIKILGDASRDDAFKQKLDDITLEQGNPLLHHEYEATKGLINSALLDLGYFDAKWSEQSFTVDLDSSSAVINLHLDSSKRYRFGPTTVAENIKANALIHRLNPMKIGTDYNSRLVSDFSIALTNMPYFKSVRVYPDIANRENGEVSIIVQVAHKPNDSFEVGAGISTDDNGLRLRFKWIKPWITQDGHYLETNIEATQIDPQAQISYTIPVKDPNINVWRFGVGYISDQLKLSERLTSQVQRQWPLGVNWLATAFLKYEVENYEISEEEFNSNMFLPGVSLAMKNALGGTTPYYGEQLLFSTEFSSESLVSDVDLIKIQLQGKAMRTFAIKHILIGRINLGTIITDDINLVPLSMRFFPEGIAVSEATIMSL
jgi:translocation and assembly module TamA